MAHTPRGFLGRLGALFRRDDGGGDEGLGRHVNPDPGFGASQLSERHVARMLGLGVGFLRRIPPGELPSMRSGSGAVYKRTDVEDYIARKREAGGSLAVPWRGRFRSAGGDSATRRPPNLVQSKVKPPR